MAYFDEKVVCGNLDGGKKFGSAKTFTAEPKCMDDIQHIDHLTILVIKQTTCKVTLLQTECIFDWLFLVN